MGKRLKQHNSPITEADVLNRLTYEDYLHRIRRLVLSIFEWTNLPNTMDSRYIEECLFTDGQAALFYDDEIGFINSRATSAGYLNMYGLPTRIHCYSFTVINTTRRLFYGQDTTAKKNEQCILVMNNWDRTPTLPSVELYAMRLADAQRVADLNIKAQANPVLVLTDQDQVITVKNAYNQYRNNEPVIFGDKNVLTGNEIKALKTDAPFVADKIMDYKREIWNELLTFLGLSNIETEKKERLITAEAEGNNEVINMNLQAMLAPRKHAAEQFNLKFGENIDVKVRSDLANYVKMTESSILKDDGLVDIGEGVENE